MLKAEAIAHHLLKQHERRETFNNLSDKLRPTSLEQAYQAQDIFHKIANRGHLGGYKIALSSKVQQCHHNISSPLIGGIFKEDIFHTKKEVLRKNYQGLGIEIELGFQLSDDICSLKKPVTLENIKTYIEEVYPVIELVNDRNANYEGLDPLSLICDNAWSGGVVLGENIINWREVDFSNLHSNLYWNQETKKRTCVMDAEPFKNLCWLLNTLINRGKILDSKMIMITGSVFLIRQADSGDIVRHVLNGGYTAELKII